MSFSPTFTRLPSVAEGQLLSLAEFLEEDNRRYHGELPAQDVLPPTPGSSEEISECVEWLDLALDGLMSKHGTPNVATPNSPKPFSVFGVDPPRPAKDGYE